MDKKKLTDEFLETLIEAAKEIGWSVDLVEIADFIKECYSLADKDIPKKVDVYKKIGGRNNR